MGHSLLLVPGVHFSADEAKRLKSLAKKGVGIDKRAEEYRKKITALESNIRDLNGNISQWKQSYSSRASKPCLNRQTLDFSESADSSKIKEFGSSLCSG